MKLTPAGHALLSMAVPIWKSTHADIDDALGEDVRTIGLSLEKALTEKLKRSPMSKPIATGSISITARARKPRRQHWPIR
jgi:hypothetical protein